MAGAVRSMSEQQEEASTLSPRHSLPGTHTHTHRHLTGTALKHSCRQPPRGVCQLSLTSSTASEEGELPLASPPTQVTLTGCCMLRVPDSLLDVSVL